MKSPAASGLAIGLTLAAALPARAALADWKKAPSITIAMTDHGFVPSRISMRSGRPYVLRFVNRGRRGHDFLAKGFFKQARVDPADGELVRDNKVDLDQGASATLRVIAPSTPGAQYYFESGHLTDAASRMKGSITVR